MVTGKKEGNLKVIAFKTGGIKLDTEDVWINPSKEIKLRLDSFLEEIKPLHSKPVIVEVEDTYYKSIVPNPLMNKGCENVQTQPVSREVLIVRQNAGSQAIGLLEVMQKQKILDYKSDEEIQALFYKLAERFEKWVMRNDNTRHA